MTPATASAAPAILPPPVSVSAADNAITFTITNPNPRFSFINCTVAILNARDVPDVIRDPAKLLQPGVLVYPTVSNILDLFAVSPGQTITRTVGNLPAGGLRRCGSVRSTARSDQPHYRDSAGSCGRRLVRGRGNRKSLRIFGGSGIQHGPGLDRRVESDQLGKQRR